MWHLLGDIGGTNLRLAAMDAAGALGPRVDGAMGQEGALLEACTRLTEKMGCPPTSVTLALAGVVEEDRVRFTNLSQTISREAVAKACGTPEAAVPFLNDFEAAAWSLAEVTRDGIIFLQGGPQPGPRVIIGPGWGPPPGAPPPRPGNPFLGPGNTDSDPAGPAGSGYAERTRRY